MPTGQLNRVEQHKMRQMAEAEMTVFCFVKRPVRVPGPGGSDEGEPLVIYAGNCAWRPRPLLATEQVINYAGIERSTVWHDFKFPISTFAGKAPDERIRADDYIEVPDQMRVFQVVANRGLDQYQIQILVDATEQPAVTVTP